MLNQVKVALEEVNSKQARLILEDWINANERTITDHEIALNKCHETIDRLEQELEAKPGAEARGIAWTDMYKVVAVQVGTDENGEPVYRNKVVKQSITARSDVGPAQAYHALKIAVAAMMVDGWRPYSPI